MKKRLISVFLIISTMFGYLIFPTQAISSGGSSYAYGYSSFPNAAMNRIVDDEFADPAAESYMSDYRAIMGVSVSKARQTPIFRALRDATKEIYYSFPRTVTTQDLVAFPMFVNSACAMDIDITYDSSVLTPVNYESFYVSSGAINVNYSSETVRAGWANGNNYTGYVGTIYFKLKNSYVGYTYINATATTYQLNGGENTSTFSTRVNIGSNGVSVSGVSISGRDTMRVGETQTLSSFVTPVTAFNKNITWHSSNTAVATVSNSGRVTAKSSGNVTITATTWDGGYSDSIDLIVNINSNSIMYYDNFYYTFYNNRESFGYPWYGYRIPKERYLQLGFSDSVAEEFYKKMKWGGNCFGMSASSILFYNNILNEYKYDLEANYPKQFNSPKGNDSNDTRLRQMIELFQVSQFYKYVDDEAISLSPSDAGIIADEIARGNPVLLEMWESGMKNGHAVVIYGYSKVADAYAFYIYDCSDFITGLAYLDNDSFTLSYVKEDGLFYTNYKWCIFKYTTYDTLLWAYNTMIDMGSNNVASLLTVGEPTYTYVVRASENMTIENSLGEVSSIVDGITKGQIEDISLTVDGYLVEEPQYNISFPTDTYTITGSSDNIVTTTYIDDYMSVEVTHKSSTPVTVSADLKEVTVHSAEANDYSVKYNVYDSKFDEMTVSGTASGEVTTILDETDVTVKGADSLTAVATVSEKETVVSADSLNSAETIVCCSSDSLQIKVDDVAASDTKQLSQRQQIDMPGYDVESGEYTVGQVLTLSKDDETIIYYTTDGSIPSADNGILYTMPIDINRSMTVKAVAIKSGYLDSKILELNYTLPYVIAPNTTVMPGVCDTVTSVDLYHNEDVEIYYTTDGSDPMEYGQLYGSPIVLYEDATIKAYALKNGVASEVVTFDYTIQHKYPLHIDDGITDGNYELIDKDSLTDLSKVVLTTHNFKENPVDADFMVAFYDENNNFLNVYINEITVEPGENIVELPVSSVAGAKKMKIFTWSKNKNAPLSLGNSIE